MKKLEKTDHWWTGDTFRRLVRYCLLAQLIVFVVPVVCLSLYGLAASRLEEFFFRGIQGYFELAFPILLLSIASFFRREAQK